MRRYELTDAQWEQIAPLLPPQKPRPGRPAEDHRQVLNGMLWILRTGAPWADLPARYGPVGTVSSRFSRWRQAGVFDRVLRCLQDRLAVVLPRRHRLTAMSEVPLALLAPEDFAIFARLLSPVYFDRVLAACRPAASRLASSMRFAR